MVTHFERLDRERQKAVSSYPPARILQPKDLRVADVAWCGDYIISSSGADKELAVWKPADSKHLFNLNRLSGARHITCSPDGRFLVSESHDRTSAVSARVWDIHNKRVLKDLNGPFSPENARNRNGVRGLIFTPDQKYLVAYYISLVNSAEHRESEHRIVVYETLSWSVVKSFPISRPHNKNRKIVMSGNGKMIAVGNSKSFQSSILIYELDSGMLREEIPLGLFTPHAIALSPDDGMLSVAGNILSKCWRNGGTNYIGCNTTGEVFIYRYDLRNRKPLEHVKSGHIEDADTIIYSRNGKHLVTASGDKTIEIRDARSGGLLITLGDRKNLIYSIEFRRDGKYLASSGGVVNVWRVDNFIPSQRATK